MTFRRAGRTALSIVVMIAAAGATAPPAPPSVEGIHDPVFETLIAFNRAGGIAHLTGAELIRRVEATGRSSPIPYRGVIWHRRMLVPGADSTAIAVETVFDRPIDLPIPYQILGYHPGSFRMSGRFTFREMPIGDLTITDHGVTVSVTDLTLYRLTEGEMKIDVDGWLDALAGSNLDDTTIEALALFRWNGVWHGLALGRNDDDRPRSGSFDFSRDKVLYPSPEELKALARHLRHVVLIGARRDGAPQQVGR